MSKEEQKRKAREARILQRVFDRLAKAGISPWRFVREVELRDHAESLRAAREEGDRDANRMNLRQWIEAGQEAAEDDARSYVRMDFEDVLEYLGQRGPVRLRKPKA